MYQKWHQLYLYYLQYLNLILVTGTLQPLLRYYLPRMNNCRMVLIKHLPNTRRTNIYPETLQQITNRLPVPSIFLMALPKKCHRKFVSQKCFYPFYVLFRKISLFLLIRPYMVNSIKTLHNFHPFFCSFRKFSEMCYAFCRRRATVTKPTSI